MPKVQIKYRFEDPNGSLLRTQQNSIDVPYNTERPHVFAAPKIEGYTTPNPQKHLVAPGHVPTLTYVYREQSAAAIIIRYLNQHGKLIDEQELDLAMGQKIDPVEAGKCPKNYHLDPKQSKTITADRIPHTVTLHITGDLRTKAVNLILDLQTPSGHTVENLTHKVAEKLRTGDKYVIDPLNYTPKGYHCNSNSEHGYLGTDGLTKPDLRFTYTAMPAAPATVTYVNQRQRRVGSYTYSGYMHQKINIMDPNHVPNGYHLLDDNPQIVVLEPNVQTDTVNVTGDQTSATATAELIYQEPTGDVIQDVTKEIPLKGQVGDMYELDPNSYIKRGYHTASYAVNGYFMPGGTISSAHAVFKYEAGAASLFAVTYVNQKGRIVSSQQLHGYVDQAVDLQRAVPVPDGYKLIPGQKTDYRCSLTPKKIRLNVQGEFQSNDFSLVQIIQDVYGRQLTHRLKTIPIKASVGDTYTVDPSNYPYNGYVPVSDPLTGIVHDRQLSVPAHRFIYRPQPVDTHVQYIDARNVVVKRVPVHSYLGAQLDVSDRGYFNQKHMPDGYQYLEIPANPTKLKMEPGMADVKIKIAPIAPQQAQIQRSSLYPSFVIDWGRWHYVREGSREWKRIMHGTKLSQHLTYQPISIREFDKKMKTLLFMKGFEKVWK